MPAPAASSALVPAREARRDRARDGAHRPAELDGEVGGGQRAGPLRRLDDDRERGQRGDEPVAGHEAPAVRREAGRQLGDHAAALADLRRTEPRREAGYGTSAPPASTATSGAAVVRPSEAAARRSSAPTWAAESTPRAMPETTGTPGAASPRPSARATSMPYAVPRRAPTIATLGAGERLGPTRDVEHRGRIGELAQPVRIAARRSGTLRSSPLARDPRPRRRRRERREPVRGPAGAVERDQLVVAEREHPRGRRAAPLDVEPRAERGDQVRPPKAVVAGGEPRHPALPMTRHAARESAWSSRRSDAARRMCAGSTVSDSARSATVRATRRMRPWPRAERRLRSCRS